MKKYFASSELIINEDGSVFHLHVKPEWLANVGDIGKRKKKDRLTGTFSLPTKMKSINRSD